jgi:type I restriction enzyme S subunit
MKSWATRPLGELVDFVGGGTPRRDRPDYWGGSIPWASVKDLQSLSLKKTIESITPEALANSAANLIAAGTVIIASRVGLGKVAINDKAVAINQDLKALKPRSNDLLPRYLLYYLLSKASYFKRVGVGATVKGLTLADYQKLEIVLPPRSEQERMVKLLDEAAVLKGLRAQADECTDKLVPALFHEMFDGAVSKTNGWPVVRVDEAGRVQLGRQRAPKYQTGKFTRPYVRVANVFEDQIDVSDLLSMDFDERDFALYKLEHGDILLNEGQSTELVGRPAMWRNEVTGCCFQNTLVRFQADQNRIMPAFALSVFLAYYRAGKFARISSKTSNVAHLGASRFSRMAFPVPPLSVQREFAARVAEVRAMRGDQAISRDRLNTLFDSLLSRTFDGDL